MILINLLPHRERRRQEQRRAFFSGLGLAAVVGVALAVFWYAVLQQMGTAQRERNDFLRAETAKLEAQISEIASLRTEIEALQARKQAVEDLQTDRNVPVYLLNELARQTPQGVYLTSIRQTGDNVVVSGNSQTNERLSEFMRNTAYQSPWLERPELVESTATNVAIGREAPRRLYAFSMRLAIKRPNAKGTGADAAAAGAVAGAAPAKTS